MRDIEITLPDGSKQKHPEGTKVLDIAKRIGEGLAKVALAGKVNDALVNLDFKITEDTKLEIITSKSPEAQEILWHSSSHLLAHAVKELYPEVQFAIGPAIEEGFYYDMDLEKTLHPEDLEAIEKKAEELIKQDVPIEHLYLSKKEALDLYKDNPYKREIIENVDQSEIDESQKDKFSFYKQGNFIDLCRGPHVPSTGKIGAIKLYKISGAYWRGDSKNKMLQRVYGISFFNKKEKEAWIKQREEAEKRNHIKLGKKLGLYSLHNEAPGCVFFHPYGAAVLNEVLNFHRSEQQKREYVEVITPLILRKELWLTSGHWDHYKENMYFTEIDGEEYAVKPMNCPGHILIYKTKRHSYRDFPIRMAEYGMVHRHELSGVLNGLFRVRKFTQDDAHTFCTEDQMKDELKMTIDFIIYVYKTFGFDYHIELSTKPEKAMGTQEIWDKAETALKEALEELNINYKLNPGDGAFYGPKIDFHIKDAIGRNWQLGTVQLDFQMPEKFDMTYIGSDDNEHRPVMIHRAMIGSFERFFGILIEHYAGKFPLWLAPVQVKIIPIGKEFNEQVTELHKKLLNQGIRSETDLGHNTVSYKIREAQLNYVPYVIVIGDKEIANNTLAIRDRDNNQKFGVKYEDFLKELKEKIEKKE